MYRMLGYTNEQKEIEALLDKAPGLLYGYGLFETLRVYKGNICFFELHINRMREACKLLDLTIGFSDEFIYKQCKMLIEADNIFNGSLRISLIMGNTEDKVLIHSNTRHYEDDKYKKGFKLCLSNIVRNSKSPLCRVKSMNYLECSLSRRYALSKGFDEAVFVNESGYLTEGTMTNLFWVSDSQLFTPKVECGLLPGITRKQIIDIITKLGYKLNAGSYKQDSLIGADEIFITNSLMGVMPVSSFENNASVLGKNSITKMLIQEYMNILLAEANN